LHIDKAPSNPRTAADYRLANPASINCDDWLTTRKYLNRNDSKIFDARKNKGAAPSITLPQSCIANCTDKSHMWGRYSLKTLKLRSAAHYPQRQPQLIEGSHRNIDPFVRNKRSGTEKKRLGGLRKNKLLFSSQRTSDFTLHPYGRRYYN
jgi:hypothetical protein